MELAVGTLLQGKITGITKFGAFVSFSEGKTGMVHISEVAHTYVNDITKHLVEGQDVNVKVIGIDNGGRVNLSIKQTTTPPQAEKAPFKPNFSNKEKERPERQFSNRQQNSRPFNKERDFERRKPMSKEPPREATFEDKLKMFMQDSESRMADIKHNVDKKSSRRRK